MGRELAGSGTPHRSDFHVDDVAGLLRAAAAGDQDAWNGLVRRFGGLLWSICRAYGLGPSDAADVFQLTWLRLLEHLDKIREPERLPGWLATTCRRECLTLLRRRNRTQPTDDERMLDQLSGVTPGADHLALMSERDSALWRAFDRLSARCRRVLRALVIDPVESPRSYALAAAALDMPIGSLGPTRKRCLAHLRNLLDAEGISSFVTDS
jgi:RNA polymerase sigma factor (sigma-70 family)